MIVEKPGAILLRIRVSLLRGQKLDNFIFFPKCPPPTRLQNTNKIYTMADLIETSGVRCPTTNVRVDAISFRSCTILTCPTNILHVQSPPT